MIVAVLLAVLAPILSRVFYFTISRKREYLADASAARLTRYPEGLASALEKISAPGSRPLRVNSITAPMYIINPLKRQTKSRAGLFSTHPPAAERIRILRSMAGGAGYLNYQSAFESVTGKGILPPSALRDRESLPIQMPVPESAGATSPKARTRGLGDLTRAVHGFAFLTCACGLKIKIPPQFKQPRIDCPRCHRTIPNPLLAISTLGGVAAASASTPTIQTVPSGKETAAEQSIEAPGNMVHTRRNKGWETIRCACGHPVQLSPALLDATVRCTKCGRSIEIKSA